MRTGRRTLRVPLVIGAMALAGCHTYRPIQTAVPGTIVRVHVPVTSALANPNAPQQTVSIEGDVLQSGDTLVLATETRRDLGAFRGEMVQFDTVRLAPDQRVGVELREFSSKRSVILGVALAGGATVLALTAFGIIGGTGGEPGPGGTPQPAVVVSGSALSAVWGLISR